MNNAQGNVSQLFSEIHKHQDKFDNFEANEHCDLCQPAPVARLFFEPRDNSSLPTLLFCLHHLTVNREELAHQNITGGFIDTDKIYWWNSLVVDKMDMANA